MKNDNTDPPSIESKTNAEPTAMTVVDSDHMKTVTVDGWELLQQTEHDDQPRVSDTVLAAHLGYRRPRKIRDLIERLVGSKDLSGLYVRPTVGRTSMPNGGIRDEEHQEYLLTQAEALFVCVKSETPKANAICKELIRVYLAYQKGLPVPAHGIAVEDPAAMVKLDRIGEAVINVAGSVAELGDRMMVVEAVGARLASIETMLAKQADGGRRLGGVVGRATGDYIRALVRDIADLQRPSLYTSKKRHQRVVDQELRERVGYQGMVKGSSWDHLDQNLEPQVFRALQHMLDRAQKIKGDRLIASQAALFDHGTRRVSQ